MAKAYKIIESALEMLEISFAYRHFKKSEPMRPPYITYYIGRESFSGSDAYNYICEADAVIELYTVAKSRDIEERIENAFAGYELEKEEDFNYEDELYRITYTFSVVSKIRRL